MEESQNESLAIIPVYNKEYEMGLAKELMKISLKRKGDLSPRPRKSNK